MYHNPYTPRVNAFEELWASGKPIPYERPLPDYYYASLDPAVLQAEVQELQSDPEPDINMDWCIDCGNICSCLKEA